MQSGNIRRWLTAGLGLSYEIMRHVLRRPVIGIAAIAQTPDGRFVLIRRGDTGTWGLPGGTLEWGETLESGLTRELHEEAGITQASIGHVVRVFSRPDRDPRFHAVTIVVRASVEIPTTVPMNPLEIREVGLFTREKIPGPLAFGADDAFEAFFRGDVGSLE